SILWTVNCLGCGHCFGGCRVGCMFDRPSNMNGSGFEFCCNADGLLWNDGLRCCWKDNSRCLPDPDSGCATDDGSCGRPPFCLGLFDCSSVLCALVPQSPGTGTRDILCF